MTDKQFLQWIHDRLEYVHQEHPCADYMWKLRSIIEAYDETKTTPNSISAN